MDQFNFRIIHTDGVDVFDTSLCTPYSSLTPIQMVEYTEADVQLHYMELKKRKENPPEDIISNMFFRLAKMCGFM